MNPVEFVSPLKSGFVSSRVRKRAPSSEKIDEIAVKRFYPSVFRTSQTAVNTPPSPQKIELREQILAIESVLSQGDNLSMAGNYRDYIRSLLSSDNHELKMAELGMILFNLDNQVTPPEGGFLVAFRASEMQREVESYIENHRKNRLHPLIPSGKTHYLMRAFSHMLFTSGQVYNRGGLYAIQEILTNPRYEICKYMQHEHIIHILNVIKNMIKDHVFGQLFKSNYQVHPTIADAIRLDLKLPQETTLAPVHVLYASMMALFADVRQIDAPNCYAVGALIYVTENHTLVALKSMLFWLTSGSIYLGDMGVPIRPLLDKRIAYSKDFSLMVSPHEVQDSILFGHLNDALDIDRVEFPHNHPMSLQALLHQAIDQNMAADQKGYAERLYHTYKSSALVQMQLAIIEFIFMNSTQKKITLKKELTMIFFSAAVPLLPTQELRDEFIARFQKRIWLENCNEGNIKIRDGALHVGSKIIDRFDGHVESLCALFSESLRLFSLEQNGEYRMLWSIEDINAILFEIIEGLVQGSSAALNEILSQPLYRRMVFNFCANQIGDQANVSARDLYQANLLLFKQVGGDEIESLRLVYGIDVTTYTLSECDRPEIFLDKLISLIHKFPKETPKVLIATTGVHAWTLTPSCLRLLHEHQNDFRNYMLNTVFHPAQMRLKAFIPDKVARQITERLGMRRITKKMTYEEFKSAVLMNVDFRCLEKAREVIEEEYSKESLSDQELDEVLRNLNISLDRRALNQLSHNPEYPFVLADKLRTVLIESGKGNIDPYQLELAICHVKNLPFAINMGDSNWASGNYESPKHSYIIIGYSYVRKGLCFKVRSERRETIEQNRSYTDFVISSRAL